MDRDAPGGIAECTPFPSPSLCTRLKLPDELVLDLPIESRGVVYRAGLRRDR